MKAGSVFRSFAVLALFFSLTALTASWSFAQTYYYQGPAFDTAECQLIYGASTPCVGGSITGTVSFSGISSSFSGRADLTNVAGYTISASGIGSLSDLSQLDSVVYFDFSNGQLGSWNFNAYTRTGPADNVNIITTLTTSGYDTGAHTQSGTTLAAAIVTTPNPKGFWTNGKTLGACDSPTASPGGVGCASPISLGTGNMYDHYTDYETVGQNKLALTRYYNSFSNPDTYAITMGQNWRSNYDRYLHFVSANYINVERMDGQVVSFSSSSGIWSTDTDIDLKLSSSGSNWLLTDPNDTVETYFTSAGKGLLSSIALRNGYTQTLSYASGSVSKVTDSYGRSLSLSYSSSTGMLTGVTTPDTLALTYGYTLYSSANTYKLCMATPMHCQS